MFRILKKLSFRKSLSKKTLLMDAGQLNNFPEECLDKEVSLEIGKRYLSVCQQNEEEILKQTVLQGVIMGQRPRPFLSIPTKLPGTNKFYNIHYLLKTGSPITTLTRRALCALHQMTYNLDYSDEPEFPLTQPIQIGGQKLTIYCSNLEKKCQSFLYHSANVLGMDFYSRFSRISFNNNDDRFTLELSKIDKDRGSEI